MATLKHNPQKFVMKASKKTAVPPVYKLEPIKLNRPETLTFKFPVEWFPKDGSAFSTSSRQLYFRNVILRSRLILNMIL